MVVTPSSLRPRDTCRDVNSKGTELWPSKDTSALDIAHSLFKRCQGPLLTPEKEENRLLKGTGEDPAADLEAFLSYETLPSRPFWSGIRRHHYDHVKGVFAQRGVPINSDTRKADMMKFKDALLGYSTSSEERYIWGT